MDTRHIPYTPWFEPDYERSYLPAEIHQTFSRRHLLRIWQGIPCIECTADGTLFCAWYSGGNGEGGDNFVILARKKPDRQWETPIAVIESPHTGVRCFDECIWIDPQGHLHLYWCQALLFFDGKEGVWETVCADPTADTLTFSKPRRLCDGVMLNRPTVLKSGRWLYTVARVPLKPFWAFNVSRIIGGDPEEGSRNAQVYASDDSGETIFYVGEAKFTHTDAFEHMVYEKENGSLRMFVRNRPTLYESISSDNGCTWSAEKDTGIPNPCSRFHIKRLPTGRLLMINHANGQTRNQLCAYLSEDDGVTWPYKLLLDERDGVSYPDACLGPDGSVYVTYDRGRFTDLEILYARITETEILHGYLMNADSFLAAVIDNSQI